MTTTTCGDGGVVDTVATRPRTGDTGTGVVVVVGGGDVGDYGAGASGGQRYTTVRPRHSKPTANGRPSAEVSCTRARPPGRRRRAESAPS